MTDREAEKQSNGCEYCKGSKVLGFDGMNDGIRIIEENGTYALDSDTWGFIIQFCPKCGRPLKGE